MEKEEQVMGIYWRTKLYEDNFKKILTSKYILVGRLGVGIGFILFLCFSIPATYLLVRAIIGLFTQGLGVFIFTMMVNSFFIFISLALFVNLSQNFLKMEITYDKGTNKYTFSLPRTIFRIIFVGFFNKTVVKRSKLESITIKKSVMHRYPPIIPRGYVIRSFNFSDGTFQRIGSVNGHYGNMNNFSKNELDKIAKFFGVKLVLDKSNWFFNKKTDSSKPI